MQSHMRKKRDGFDDAENNLWYMWHLWRGCSAYLAVRVGFVGERQSMNRNEPRQPSERRSPGSKPPGTLKHGLRKNFQCG